SGSGSYYETINDCNGNTNQRTSINIAAGSSNSTQQLYFKSSIAQIAHLNAHYDNVIWEGHADVSVISNTAANRILLDGMNSFSSGMCQMLHLYAIDSQGRPATIQGSPVFVNVSTSGLNGSLYPNQNCNAGDSLGPSDGFWMSVGDFDHPIYVKSN